MGVEADAPETNPAETDPPPPVRTTEHPVSEMEIADDALVILIGPSGCGKSTFARMRFPANEIVSSDECRRMVSDDEGSQAASRAAFAVFDALVYGRLAHARRVVADATSLAPWSRELLRAMAAEHGRPVVAIAFDAPLDLCVAQQASRDRRVAPDVVELHHAHMQQALAELPGEGYTHLYIVRPKMKPEPSGPAYRYGDFPGLFWDLQKDVEIDPENPSVIARVLQGGDSKTVWKLIPPETLIRRFPELVLPDNVRAFWAIVIDKIKEGRTADEWSGTTTTQVRSIR